MNQGLQVAAANAVHEPLEYTVRVNIVGMIRVQAAALGIVCLICVMSFAMRLQLLSLLALLLYFLTTRVGWLVLRGTAAPLRLRTGGGVLALSTGTVYLLRASPLTGKPGEQIAAWPRSDVAVSAAPGRASAWPSVWIDVEGQSRARLEIASNGGKVKARAELIAALGTPEQGMSAVSPGPATAPRQTGEVGTRSSGERGRFLTDSEKAALAAVAPPATAAAWYPDPFEPGMERYWTGSQWSGRTLRMNG